MSVSKSTAWKIENFLYLDHNDQYYWKSHNFENEITGAWKYGNGQRLM